MRRKNPAKPVLYQHWLEHFAERFREEVVCHRTWARNGNVIDDLLEFVSNFSSGPANIAGRSATSERRGAMRGARCHIHPATLGYIPNLDLCRGRSPSP